MTKVCMRHYYRYLPLKEGGGGVGLPIKARVPVLPRQVWLCSYVIIVKQAHISRGAGKKSLLTAYRSLSKMFALKSAVNKAVLPATRVGARRCVSSAATRSGKKRKECIDIWHAVLIHGGNWGWSFSFGLHSYGPFSRQQVGKLWYIYKRKKGSLYLHNH